jgi:hypothetical protein
MLEYRLINIAIETYLRLIHKSGRNLILLEYVLCRLFKMLAYG